MLVVPVRTRPVSPTKDKQAAQRPPAGLGIGSPYPPGCEAAASRKRREPRSRLLQSQEGPHSLWSCMQRCIAEHAYCMLHMGRHGTAPGGVLDRDAHLSDAMGRTRAALCGHRDIPYRRSVPRHQHPAARRQKSCKGERGVARVVNRTIRRYGARSRRSGCTPDHHRPTSGWRDLVNGRRALRVAPSAAERRRRAINYGLIGISEVALFFTPFFMAVTVSCDLCRIEKRQSTAFRWYSWHKKLVS